MSLGYDWEMLLKSGYSLQELINSLPQTGRVEWIGVRPARKQPMVQRSKVKLLSNQGIVGDRYSGKSGKRHVTLIQSEHLTAIPSYLGIKNLDPSRLRRNIVISGINLFALKDRNFELGTALLEYTGQCHPCSAMEAELGVGGYNAVRGHGGITARILRSGTVEVGDQLIAQKKLSD